MDREREREFEGQAGSGIERRQEAQKWDRARLEACFVLFVVEPFPLRSHTESGRGSGALTTLFP